ncbi:disulfide bond formation protein B [Afipia sp. TerB]
MGNQVASEAAFKPGYAGQASNPALIAAGIVAIIATATIAGAWFFELVLGIQPCELCLEQRYAYYLIIPVAIVLAWAAARGAPRALLLGGLGIVALAAFANAALGTYHTGVEWGWWAGPTACSGPITDFGKPGNLLESLKTLKVVRCDEVQWRFLGLSLAGYNVLISLAMAIVALWGLGAASRKSAL